MASKFSISATEALHIGISAVTIALAFTLFPAGSFKLQSFGLALVTVGLAFVLHELGHKFVAIHYGAQAEYRAWTAGLFFALLISYITDGSFIFAATGAVYIYGKRVTQEQNGRIALAGPFVNLLLALVFIAIGLSSPELAGLASWGVSINIILGVFNMIPVGPLDGRKVFNWNKIAWLAILISLILVGLLNPFPVNLQL